MEFTEISEGKEDYRIPVYKEIKTQKKFFNPVIGLKRLILKKIWGDIILPETSAISIKHDLKNEYYAFKRTRFFKGKKKNSKELWKHLRFLIKGLTY